MLKERIRGFIENYKKIYGEDYLEMLVMYTIAQGRAVGAKPDISGIYNVLCDLFEAADYELPTREKIYETLEKLSEKNKIIKIEEIPLVIEN
ncbi:MAG: hypothetical protein ACE5J4_03245 [Candidatus Aenigmatarchaeota archaeon]